MANFVIRFFQRISGAVHKGVDYIADFSKEIFDAFLPVLQSEAGVFVKQFKVTALKIALEAAKQCVSNKEKVIYFSKAILKEAKVQGIPFVKEHLVNLLREICVAELKSRGLL